MGQWDLKKLRQLIEADDLHVAPLRADGKTYGTPTWIWAVEIEGILYVRAYNGQDSSWYRAAISQKAGKIVAAGREVQVSFDAVSDGTHEAIDTAYREKYSGSPYLSAMVSKRARSATIQIAPINDT